MKIKPAQILAGIAVLAYILSNFLNVFIWTLDQNGSPGWGMVTWQIYFMMNGMGVISIFTFFFNKKVLRYIAAGIYIITRLISSLLAIMSFLPRFLDGNLPIALFARLVVGWPYWDGRLFPFIAGVFGFISSILFVIAIILSFLNQNQIEIPIPKYSGRKVQGAYGDIEVLGDLLEKGLLTQKEFDLKKREILGLDK
jgi:hypothetical protein